MREATSTDLGSPEAGRAFGLVLAGPLRHHHHVLGEAAL